VTPSLLTHTLQLDIAVLPGVASVGEVMAVLEHGLAAMKFFPAGRAGGPNVACVGGSWFTPRSAIESHDWQHIVKLAQGAASLRLE
jgi:2-dehydro-3-deoxyphosphogluconate aldolase/(4S)-4-hydroxy-2-oxoglutarate aldolase